MDMTTPHLLYNALCRLGRQIHRMEHWAAFKGFLRGGRRFYRGQMRLLTLISQKNGASQRDLAEEMDVRPSSMAEMLSKLEAAGYITRTQDENDQRIMRIFLTKAGEDAVVQSSETVPDWSETLFSCLTAEEQAQMLALTEKLNTSLEAMDRPCMPGGHHHGFHLGPFGRHGRNWAHACPFARKDGPDEAL